MNLGAKKDVAIVACNWAGGPTAAGSYTYKYKIGTQQVDFSKTSPHL